MKDLKVKDVMVDHKQDDNSKINDVTANSTMEQKKTV
jgi:hypothetical protein